MSRLFSKLTVNDQVDNNLKNGEMDGEMEDRPATIAQGQGQNWLPDEGEEGQLSVDVYQTPDDVVIKSTIAGVQPEDIDIDINNDMITIRGERREDVEVSEEDYFYQECYWGSFSRSIILPVEVVSEEATASLKNGVLTVRIPKSRKTKSVAVKVKAE